jgi:hypothetical protein
LTKTESILYINNHFYFWDKSEKKEISSPIDHPTKLPSDAIVFVDTPDFNLIPLDIAKNIPSDKKAEFLTTNTDNKSIIINNINLLDSELCWLIDDSDSDLIHKKVPGSTIKHITEALINRNFHSKNSILLFNTKSAVFISANCDNKFKIINRFPVSNEDDLLYYTLLTIKETGLSKKKFTIDYHGVKKDIFIQKLTTILPKCTIEQAENNSYLSILN